MSRWDLVLQTTNQTLAHRLVLYFQGPQRQLFYPPDFATEAVELGPHGNHHGPCLTLFKNVSVAPTEVTAWLAGSLMRRYVTRAYWLDPSIPPALFQWGTAGSRYLAAGSPLRPDPTDVLSSKP